MPKHHIMRVSGWLPVSYSVFMRFERNIGEECYNMAKMVADDLNDNPKITNKKFIKLFAKHAMLDDKKLIIDEILYLSNIESLIDFIRDSLIIYQDTIRQEREDTIGAVLT
jgi:hypothetical protein